MQMGFYYDKSELKTLNDHIFQLKEIEAYRELDGQDFDFGNGLIINKMSLGSEDAYYEMDIQVLEDKIANWEYKNRHNKPRNNSKYKLHRRVYEQKEKKRLEFLSKVSRMNVMERSGCLQRCYRGKRSAHLKKKSNRRIRYYKGDISSKGRMCHKLFDFWWELD